MRIVGGIHKGKKLNPPKDQKIRPTTDRIRETIFNILQHGLGRFQIEDVTVLDLFAGTGALGLEALSHGARLVVFIELDANARGLLRQNIESLNATGSTKLFRRDATHLGPLKRYQPFDLVFLDPPYNQGLGEQALLSAHQNGWIKDGAFIVFEEDCRAEIDLPDPFTQLDERKIGDSIIRFYRYHLT